MQFYGFVVSHFTEKARWALDYKGASYEAIDLCPGPHHVRKMKQLRRKKTTVPLLIDGDEVIQESSEIIDYLERKIPEPALEPDSEADRKRARELEAWADTEVGVMLRGFAYDSLLRRPDLTVPLWTQGGPRGMRLLYRATWPLMAGLVRRSYCRTPERVAEARDRLCRAVDELDTLLEQQSFLSGERFGRLDLSVAALLGPLIRPPGHVCAWPEKQPAPLEALEAELGDSRVVQHSLRMYAEYRAPRNRTVPAA